MLLAAVIAKALAEVALLALAGQGLLYMLAGERREQNVFYQLLRAAASPALGLARLLVPRFFPPLWTGLVALSMVAALWVIATYYKICLLANAC